MILEPRKFEPLKLGCFCLLLSAFVFYLKYTDTDVVIKSPNDLCLTKGHLLSYHFVRGYRGAYDYTFRLKEYANPFQIKADFSDIFQEEAFKTLQEGEELTVGIYKNESGCLNDTTKNVRIYALENSKTVFLPTDAALKIQNSNNIYYVLAAITFMGLALIRYDYLEKKRKKWTRRIKYMK
jgi:hypothetical protein